METQSVLDKWGWNKSDSEEESDYTADDIAKHAPGYTQALGFACEPRCKEHCAIFIEAQSEITFVVGGLGQPPTQATSGSVGWDIRSPYDVDLAPGQIVNIELGVSVQLPKRFGAFLKARSSLALQGVELLGGVVDNDYKGILHAICINHSDKEVNMKRSDRVFQLVPFKMGIEKTSIRDETGAAITATDPQRKRKGGLGSTGR